jgi:L-threonylcarbamoyladenylate synthase
MKTVTLTSSQDESLLCQEIARVLKEGGLACLPCSGRYRIVADLTNEDAVLAVAQSKGRVHDAPALVFVDGEKMLDVVAAPLAPGVLQLARAIWPQSLTIRVTPHPQLPARVLRQLGGKKSRIGVRIPEDALVRATVTALGRPLYVSSANREHKPGENSVAQIRKNFGNHVQIFVDCGDLAPRPASTVVDLVEGRLVFARVGAVRAETVEAVFLSHQAVHGG